jgi:2-oxoglutarate dehydrogenase E1 component
MSPKSLLRHPKCVSDISEIYTGKFEELIDDVHTLEPSKVKKVLFCSVKCITIYWKKKNRKIEKMLLL